MPTRRDFLQLPLAALPPAAYAQSGRKGPAEDDPSNIKLAHRVIVRSVTDDELLFYKQIGMRWAHAEFGGQDTPLEFIRATQERFARYNVKIYTGVHDSYRSIRLQLGQPGRDQDIETFQRFLRDCGRAGIPVAKIDWHPANTYTTNMVDSPRGYRAREFNLADFRAKVEKQRFEREYSADDIWASFSYFLKAVLPVAKEANVRLALHPDDPPVAKMNGVAKIFVHFDGIRRADEIAGSSPFFGMTFCAGTWMEGGKEMGKDVFEMIDWLGDRKKIFTVHFRNVSTTMPHFVETFPDDGYTDMYQVMKALRKVRFSGSMVPDHIPALAGDTGGRRAGLAYCIAYMRALLRRANEEVG
jgi:mannonate dehydratase